MLGKGESPDPRHLIAPGRPRLYRSIGMGARERPQPSTGQNFIPEIRANSRIFSAPSSVTDSGT